MKVRLDALIKTIDGKDFMQPGAKPDDPPEPKPVTVREALFQVLTSQLRGDEDVEIGQKLRIHRLAKRVDKGASIENFDTSEVEIFKARANKLFGQHFLGQLVDLLEGNDEESGVFASESARTTAQYQPDDISAA